MFFNILKSNYKNEVNLFPFITAPGVSLAKDFVCVNGDDFIAKD